MPFWPADLLSLIFDLLIDRSHLTDRHAAGTCNPFTTLRACCHVSRQWAATAQPHLFRDICILSDPLESQTGSLVTFDSLLRALRDLHARSSALPHCVRSLIAEADATPLFPQDDTCLSDSSDEAEAWDDDSDSDAGLSERVHPSLHQVACAIALCPELQKLDLKLVIRPRPEHPFAPSPHTGFHAADVAALREIKALTHLTLRGPDDNAAVLRQLLNAFPTVTHLDISHGPQHADVRTDVRPWPVILGFSPNALRVTSFFDERIGNVLESCAAPTLMDVSMAVTGPRDLPSCLYAFRHRAHTLRLTCAWRFAAPPDLSLARFTCLTHVVLAREFQAREILDALPRGLARLGLEHAGNASVANVAPLLANFLACRPSMRRLDIHVPEDELDEAQTRHTDLAVLCEAETVQLGFVVCAPAW